MNDAAKRVRELRERTGKSVEEMASLLDMSRMSYFDIEFHDDELESVPSLKQVRQLAQYLGVSAAQLVTGSTRDVNERIRWHDLVAPDARLSPYQPHDRGRLRGPGGLEAGRFLRERGCHARYYPVDFLQVLCKELHISWVDALP